MPKIEKKANLLFGVHTVFSRSLTDFRERVCEDCNYSVPTFYRKMRKRESVIDGKTIPPLSKAEQTRMKEIAEEVKNDIIKKLDDLFN